MLPPHVFQALWFSLKATFHYPPSLPKAQSRSLETPRLILDADRLEHNAARMRERSLELGVSLRPHLKTAKSLEVARIATNGTFGPITVSTLNEAEYFARGGYKDLLYAVSIVGNKLARVDQIQRTTDARILLVVDSVEAAKLLVERTIELNSNFGCLIEIDCGEHRSGVLPVEEDVLPIAEALAGSRRVRLDGVMTHAGHSYSTADRRKIAEIAEIERRSAVEAARILQETGVPTPIVSVGSTPTVLFAEHLGGVTEVRCGIYLFWDMAQFSRGVCRMEEIAISVLAAVIGHNRQGSRIIVDAGALALSKDLGANEYLPDTKYGYVCDSYSGERLSLLSVDSVHQEHGAISVKDASWFDRLPIGSLVRIVPNHACLTCAAYFDYTVVREGTIVDQWERTNGW